MLMPNRTKYRKVQKKLKKKVANRGTHLAFGEVGLNAL